MGMIASVSLFAISTFIEVAHLGLVNALSDTQVSLAMRVDAVLTDCAMALQKCLAQLSLL
jgi:hypothetical protein